MKSIVFLLIILLINITLILSKEEGNGNLQPKTVKLSVTSVASEMQVSWFTMNEIGESFVQFSEYENAIEKAQSGGQFGFKSSPSLIFMANGSSSPFDSQSQWSGYSHTVVIKNLQPNTVYYYQCGGSISKILSQTYQFKTSNFNAETGINDQYEVTPFTAAVYGDMGFGGGFNNTVNTLLTNIDRYDMVFHVGDISYADYDNVQQGNQSIWNDFLQTLEPITSRIPYMTVPGNHDIFYSFQAYQQTFNMPGSSQAPWYSFDYNGVHFLAFSTESDLSPFTTQYQWIKSDLEAYRKQNPDGWLIAYAHRPYYCCTQYDWCKKQTLRALIESTIGELFQQYNVDIFMAGHTHAYERSYPVYEQVIVGDYNYPGGTVHLVIGTPGNQEGLEIPSNWISPKPIWNAYRYAELGYAQFSVFNATHIFWEWIRDSDQSTMDSQWFVKGYFD